MYVYMYNSYITNYRDVYLYIYIYSYSCLPAIVYLTNTELWPAHIAHSAKMTKLFGRPFMTYDFQDHSCRLIFL